MRNASPSLAVWPALAAIVLGCSSAGAPHATLPAATASAAAEPPANSRLLAVPGPAAAECADDAACSPYRCNRAYGKCAFPCVTDADCGRGATCFTAAISTCQRRPPNAP